MTVSRFGSTGSASPNAQSREETIFGSQVAGIGDINGDGIDDFAVAATSRNQGTIADIRVVFGQAGGFADSVDLSTATDPGGFTLRYDSDNGHQATFGYTALEAAGDFNNDGYDDFIVGDYRAISNGEAETGNAYLVLGGATTADTITISQTLTDPRVIKLAGTEGGSRTGYDVDGAGDVNGDGYDDLIIGAPQWGNTGAAFVVYGHATPAGEIALQSDTAHVDVITGPQDNASFGFSVAGAGDLDKDGLDDIAIGAPLADHEGMFLGRLNTLANSGRVHLLAGRASGGFEQVLDETGDGTTHTIIGGTTPQDRFGSQIASNGKALAIAAWEELVRVNSVYRNGVVYVTEAPTGSDITLADVALASATRYVGAASSDPYSSEMDLLGNNALLSEGEDSAFVTFGASTSPGVGYVDVSQSANGFELVNAASSTVIFDVANLGDIDGDGTEDFAVSTYTRRIETGSSDNFYGEVFVFHGANSALSLDDQITAILSPGDAADGDADGKIAFDTAYESGAALDSGETGGGETGGGETGGGEDPEKPDFIISELVQLANPTDDVYELFVRYSVQNVGPAAAGSPHIGFYLSEDDQITAEDTRLGTYQALTHFLETGETTINSVSVDLPETLQAGTYYVGAVADWNSRVDEEDETNNGTAIQVTLDGAPDLDTTPTNVDTSRWLPGETVSVSVRITNKGNIAALPATHDIYLARAATPDTPITVLHTVSNTDPIPARTTFTDSFQYTVPEGLSPNDYVLVTRADINGDIAESDETNNVNIVANVTVPKYADLTASILSWSTEIDGVQNGPDLVSNGSLQNYTFMPGETPVFGVRLHNSGERAAEASTTAILLATHQSDGTTRYDVIGTAVTSGPLDVGAHAVEYVPTVIPKELDRSLSYSLHAWTNYNTDFPEIDTDNNISFSANSDSPSGGQLIKIGGLPDLTFEVLGVQVDAGNGVTYDLQAEDLPAFNFLEGWDVTVTVNPVIDIRQSTQSASTQFYWSNDPFIDANDIARLTLSYDFRFHDTLPWPQESSFTIPELGEGPLDLSAGSTIYLLADIDFRDEVTESDEGNNLQIVAEFHIASAPSLTATYTETYHWSTRTTSQPGDGPVTVSAGDRLSSIALIGNSGDRPFDGTFEVRMLVDDDDIRDANDEIISTERSTGSWGGGSQGFAHEVEGFYIPTDLAPGTQYLGFEVFGIDPDSGDLFGPSDGSNVSYQELNVLGPDLAASALGLAPVQPTQPNAITVQYDLLNLGDGDTWGGVTHQVVLSNDLTIDSGDRVLATGSTQVIAAGGRVAGQTASALLPTGLADGDYYLGVVVDPADQFAEHNEGNNSLGVLGLRVTDGQIRLTAPITGTAGGDALTGTALGDSILGLAGGDTIHGHGGHDVLYGDGGNDTIYGEAGADILLGGIGADTLLGGSGDDVVNGGSSPDRLFGGAGADTMDGGEESDVHFVDALDTVIDRGTIGYDKAQINDAAGVTLNLTGWGGIERINGFTGDDVIDGSSQTTDLLLFGSDGDDTLTGGSGDDVLIGGNGHDRLVGNAGRDVLLGGGGNDIFDGGAGNDILYIGETGDMVFDGGTGFDKAVVTDATGITLTVGNWAGVERINGLDGNDIIDATGLGTGVTLSGAGGDDTLTGGASGDVFYGGAGHDVLNGAGGADALIGGAGDDRIDGGAGNDFYLGGAGQDVFKWSSGFGRDVVKDFTDGTDRLDFTGHAGVTSIADLNVSQSGNHTLIRLTTSRAEQITLVDTLATTVTASDFDFV